MKVGVFSTKSYDREYLLAANQEAGHELTFFEPRLTAQTCRLADGFPAVCVFVNDQLDADADLLVLLAALEHHHAVVRDVEQQKQQVALDVRSFDFHADMDRQFDIFTVRHERLGKPQRLLDHEE